MGLGKRDSKKRDLENGILKNGIKKTRLVVRGKNGIRKTGLVVRGKNGIRKTRLEKTGFGKTGFGLQADRARPGKNSIISVCALQLQLQSYKRVYVCPELTWLEWCSHGLPTSTI
jgi:hypothetical protein